MLERKDYRSLRKVILLVVAFINQSTEYNKTAPMLSVHTWYSDIVTDLTGDVGRWAWGEKDLSRLQREANKFRKVLIETLN